MTNTDIISPYASWGRRIGATLTWLGMALVFALAGWVFALQPITTTLGNWNLARDYQPVEGTVVERTGSDDGGSFTWYSAQYIIDGKAYQTTRMTVLDDEMIDEPSNDAVQKSLAASRREQKPVTVWVSPRKPDVAVASRELPLKSLWQHTPMAIIFTILAAGGALGAVGALANFSYYRRMHDAAGLWVFSALWCGLIFPMLTLVMTKPNIEGFAIGIVGVFAAIGALLLWGAIAASISGKSSMKVSGFGGDAKDANLSKKPPSTSGGHKGKRAKGSGTRHRADSDLD